MLDARLESLDQRMAHVERMEKFLAEKEARLKQRLREQDVRPRLREEKDEEDADDEESEDEDEDEPGPDAAKKARRKHTVR